MADGGVAVTARDLSRVNIIGAAQYTKSCSEADRWSVEVSEDQAAKIAAAVKDGFVNVRQIQGRVIDISDGKSPWYGDNLGRVAEGLSLGKIQLQQDEVTAPGVVLSDTRTWTSIRRVEALGWRSVAIVYVHPKDTAPSEQLLAEATDNPDHVLYGASKVFAGQYVALTATNQVVVADSIEPLLDYMDNPASVGVI